MTINWWDCDHEAKGFPGCPLCDKNLDEDTVLYLKRAKRKILELQLVVDNFTENVLPKIEPFDYYN